MKSQLTKSIQELQQNCSTLFVTLLSQLNINNNNKSYITILNNETHQQLTALINLSQNTVKNN